MCSKSFKFIYSTAVQSFTSGNIKNILCAERIRILFMPTDFARENWTNEK